MATYFTNGVAIGEQPVPRHRVVAPRKPPQFDHPFSPPPAGRLNQHYPFAVTPGLPIVFYGGVGGLHSLDDVVSQTAQALHDLGVNVRIVENHEHVEDKAQRMKFRHLLYETPAEDHAAIFVDRHDPQVDMRRVKFSAVIDGCDSFLTSRPRMLARFNAMDTVFTYSNHSQAVMLQAGCKDVTVMPLGVDTGTYYPRETVRDFPFPKVKILAKNFDGESTGHRFVFLIVGMMQPKKGVRETVKAYCKAFAGRDDVLLWVHGRTVQWGKDESALMGSTRVARVPAGVTPDAPTKPPMLWTDGPVEESTLAEMLNRADCYVSAHRLEGFGLMPLKAMSCGTPAIATDYSGPRDYLTPDNAMLLPATEGVAIGIPNMPIGAKWATVAVEQIVHRMLEITTLKERRQSLAIAGRSTAEQWPWRRAAEAIVQRIEAAGHRVSYRLPASSPHVDILIPVRNGANDIDRMLQSLCDCPARADYRVTVCDDGSMDDTWEVLQRWIAAEKPFDLKLIRNAKPLGCPATRNRLFAESYGEFVFMADCDLEFTQDGWLDLLLRSDGLQTGITAPMLTTAGGRIQSAGGMANREGIPCVHRFYGEDCQLAAANEACTVLYAPGAALLFRRSILDTIGGLWEQYRPTTFDDVDWLMKARSHGLHVWYEPKVKIVHHEGSFRSKTNPHAYHHHNQNRFISQWPTLPE